MLVAFVAAFAAVFAGCGEKYGGDYTLRITIRKDPSGTLWLDASGLSVTCLTRIPRRKSLPHTGFP